MSATFKNAMEQAFRAGGEYMYECERGTTPGGGVDFEEWFASFLKDIETKAREAYEAPIRLTPAVTLPGPDWNELDAKIKDAFRLPPHLVRGGPPPAVTPPELIISTHVCNHGFDDRDGLGMRCVNCGVMLADLQGPL